jgi:hypothetical protein
VLLSLVVAALVLVPIAVFESSSTGCSYLGLGGSASAWTSRGALSRPRGSFGPGHGRAFDRPRLRDGDRLAAALRLRHGNPLPAAWALGAAALGVGLLARSRAGRGSARRSEFLAMTWPAGSQAGAGSPDLVALAARWWWRVTLGREVSVYLPFVGAIDRAP